MNLEDVAGSYASQLELDASRSAQRRQSDGLQAQLVLALEDCIQTNLTPPRIDVVASIERLQTIGPALRQPISESVVAQLIDHLNQFDPTRIQNRSDLIRLIQGIVQSTNSTRLGLTRTEPATESATFHRHRRRAQTVLEPDRLSGSIRRLIKFIFG